MKLQFVLVCFSAIFPLAFCQQAPDDGPPRRYVPIPIRSAEQRRQLLMQSPELLELAARTNERIFFEIDGPEFVVIVQENVNVNMDCLPWLMLFPGGDIQWLRRARDIAGNPAGEFDVIAPGVSQRVTIGGPFNRWLNITGTLITGGAQDATTGDYVCSVCIGRGTPFEQCHNATTSVHGIGSPPVLVKAMNNVPLPGFTEIYDIGANFCITLNETRDIAVSCTILTGEGVPEVIPVATRSWVMNGDTIYTQLDGATPQINDSFFMQGRNVVFMQGLVIPQPLELSGLNGLSIELASPAVGNITMEIPEIGLTRDTFTEIVFEEILGVYTCTVSNIYGQDTAQTTIRRCGVVPVLPDCGAETVLFPGPGGVVPVGCDVCVIRGTSIVLTCLAQQGTEPTYFWSGPNNIISNEAILPAVRVPGQYNCTVTNLEAPQGLFSSSNIIIYDPLTISATIRDQFGDRTDNGCNRLRRPLALADNTVCVLLGETLFLNCVGDNLLTSTNGSVVDQRRIVTEDLDGETFQCRRMATQSQVCDASEMVTVRVFDPARVDRSRMIAGEIIAGSSTMRNLVTENSTVTLACPTSGIDDPQTAWTRQVISQDGDVSEVILNDTSVHTISTRDNGEITVLTINRFTGSRDDGIFVCRTENIAGTDVAFVSLTSTPDGAVWVAGDFTECNVLCRDGVRVRSVTCRSTFDGRLLPNDQCPQDRPASVVVCADLFPSECLLTPVYVIRGEFGPCSRGCAGGFRERTVDCVLPMTGEVLADQNCSPLIKPRDKEQCRNRCCEDDTYRFCRYFGSALCNSLTYQQGCCWTCLIKEIP